MNKFLIIILIVCCSLSFAQISWPHPPQDQIHPIGNSWGLFQDYGGNPYVHNGNDIMTQPLWPVTVIRDGYVKKIWRSGQLYTGITVADSAGAGFCSGYMYYHVDPTTILVTEGDTVYVGDTIARIVTWPVANFHHNHFSKNRNSGVIWSSYGGFFRNPLTEFVPDDDSIAPVFTDAVAGQKFAICRDNTSSYLDPDSVYGNVDFICRFEDKINHLTWFCAVYKLIYSVYDTAGTYVVPPMIGVQFSDSLDGYSPPQVRVVYKDDAICNSNCNYDSLARRLYYIFTNSDGDSAIESTDSLESWRTTTVPNGPYWVKVVASDEYGNSVAESMLVWVKNPMGREEEEQHDTYHDLLAISPNPAKSSVNFYVTGNHLNDINLRVFDVSGKLVRSIPVAIKGQKHCKVVWDLSDDKCQRLPAGVYFVEAKTIGREKRLKLIILN